MTRYGFTLMCELRDPKELVRQAVAAEEAGFDFLVISDHFHPWLGEHEHSPFAWSVLGAVADRTSRIEMATMVTCPFVRYHPAIVAQAAATIGVMSDGRFTLGLGAGENLNEHVVGAGWPAVDVRHEMLRESIEAIQELWQGGYVTRRGRHVTVEDARIFDLPATPPGIFVAGSGTASAELAAETGNGLCMTEPDRDTVDIYLKAGGDERAVWGQQPLVWTDDVDQGGETAHERFRFGVPGWKVMSELPNPVNFDAATSTVTVDDVTENVVVGSSTDALTTAFAEWTDAGVQNLAVVQVGDDVDGFLRAWADEIRPALG
jgi:G6PDH family F420-dependent oxidoreductase